jgi:hypothetical protein
MWLKYDSKPISLAEYADRPQKGPREDGYRSDYQKPCGTWITDDSEHCWREWCTAENFIREKITHKHRVILDETNILFLRCAYDLDDFTRDFGVDIWWGPDGHPRKHMNRCIEWEKVSGVYDGIIITPYIWERRMDLNWYYTWDCASGCIWNVRAIKAIDLIEVSELDAEKTEAA